MMPNIRTLRPEVNRPAWVHMLREISETAVLLFVTRAMGSTPREMGAWMIVTENNAHGTIGGGNLEYQATGKAREILLSGDSDQIVETFLLGPDLNQCCGGAVDILFCLVSADENELREPGAQREWVVNPGTTVDTPITIPLIEARNRAVIYGAGHVGLECADILERTGFDVRLIDPRAGRRELVMGNVSTYANDETIDETDAYILVMTHDHQLDFDICQRLLGANRFRFLGLIGSGSKIARFKKRLREADISDQAIARLTSPIGLPSIHGKEPAVIAVSVTAQILELQGEHAMGRPADLRSLLND